jgi:chemotaxis-related protein WspD
VSTTDEPVSPCFRTIGVWGDQSCTELETHVHCLRCPVFEAAARGLFDRPPPASYTLDWTRVLAEVPAEVAQRGTSHLVFRVGTEWLALPSRLCVEVTPHRGAHPLAHRKSPAFEGIVNVRGQLLLACSLRALLGVPDATSSAARALLLVVALSGGRFALVIDEVGVVRRVTDAETRALPATLSAAVAHHVHAIVEEDERLIGLIDPGALERALERCVA